jgi:hypothetical protein
VVPSIVIEGYDASMPSKQHFIGLKSVIIVSTSTNHFYVTEAIKMAIQTEVGSLKNGDCLLTAL